MAQPVHLLDAAEPRAHIVQFYGEHDRFFARNVGRYLAEGLKRGEGLLVIAKPDHRQAFARELDRPSVVPALTEGRLVFLDSRATLDRLSVGGQPDRDAFLRVVGEAIRQVQIRSGTPRLRAYGDMVGVLWDEGNREAALQLESYWNELLSGGDISLFCGYPVDLFGPEFATAEIDPVLCAHTHLVPVDVGFEHAIDRAMIDVLGPRAGGVKSLLETNFRSGWAMIPRVEAIVLSLRNNLPEAEQILERARMYSQAN
jgi:hypothetical protein